MQLDRSGKPTSPTLRKVSSWRLYHQYHLFGKTECIRMMIPIKDSVPDHRDSMS